jgi:hypothetical protein
MATSYKILGQLAAASAVSATETIYTVPSSTEAVLSTITICNRGTAAINYRIAVRPDGTAVNTQHYIAYDAYVPGNDTIALTLGISLNASDVLSGYAGNANLTFNAFGAEIV